MSASRLIRMLWIKKLAISRALTNLFNSRQDDVPRA
jgi:hypothetical protein